MKTLKALALATVPIVGAFLCLFLYHATIAVQDAGDDERAIAQSAAATLTDADSAVQSFKDAGDQVKLTIAAAQPALVTFRATESKLNDAIDLTSHRINDLCPTPSAADAAIHPCGTLADTDRTLATLRGTSGQVEKSLLVFNRHEDDLFAQERDAYAEMNKSVTDFDALVSDKGLRSLIANGVTISGDAAAMTTDGRNWLHAKLYPTKKKGIASMFDAAGDRVHHWEPSIF